MKNINYNKVVIASIISIFVFIGCKKKDLNISEEGLRPSTYIFDPLSVPGGRLELVGDDFVTLELGQKYVDQGAIIVDTADAVVDANGNIVDSLFNNKPVFSPDLTTEGVKTAVYFFRTKDGKECSVYRNIVVYKRPSNPQTNDISGTYFRGANPNQVVKIIDGVYYMKNLIATASALRKNVPALFYHTNDSLINIIPQYYQLTTASQWETITGTRVEDRMIYFAGYKTQKISYGPNPTNVTITYNINTTGSSIAHDAVWNSVSIKTTDFIIKK
jgi:hypothetical protein